MANAMIFYRLKSNNTDKASVPNPSNLPAGQKLLFTPPGALARKIQDDYTNNIVRVSPTQPYGRHVNQNDEGFSGWILHMEGDYYQADATAAKLHQFRKHAQGEDTYHPFGIFGVWYPNGPGYVQDNLATGCATGLSIDPDSTHGLMIVTASGNSVGITKELVDFVMQLSYGGDI